ncbi:MAG TPA: M50 family metallopeptidase [Chthoniobacterales bacterium]|nr:M50 family metallopeptidase [Chthoniobacterales bacterium]
MQGTIRLFKFAGIQVYLHFTWFIIAAYEFTQRINVYERPIWSALEYLALFGIVLLHEFGHALACRQTGGTADQIVLWPLGGIAFVDPPRRPGAVLWSIAAGPLVNVVLFPIFLILLLLIRGGDMAEQNPDLVRFVSMVAYINGSLLVFNLLPVYPLDGGQILRALLWFPLGEIRSLQIASVIGLIGSVALAGLFLMLGIGIFWTAILAFFLFSRAIAGWQYANAMLAEKKAAEVPPPIP